MLSSVVLTHNNQDTLGKTLDSLSWSPEVIVVDDFSTDKTVQIAKKHKARVFSRATSGDWSAQRNFALTKTKHDWVLFIDSDEQVSPSLKREILTNLKSLHLTHGYFLHRQDIFLGKKLKHGETSQVRLLRLGNKNFGHWVRPVHETWQIQGKTKVLKSPLIHNRNITITDFITRINYYTSLEKQTFRWIDLLKPKLKFLYNYFYLKGFKDGFPGFVMAYLMSLNSLTVRIKSWEKQHH